MNPAVQKVQQLITLAVDSAVAENEARNAALSAVKLIKKNGLHIVDKLIPPPREPDEVAERIIRSKYDSTCRWCGDSIFVGDRVYWARGKGVRHVRCTE